MSTKFFFILSFIFIINDYSAQIQHAIGIPQYNSLYRGYDNKIVLASNKGKVVNPRCLAAEIKEADYIESKCYLIRPNNYSSKIEIKFDVVDKKGKIIGKDSVEFFVRPFPSLRLTISQISKSSNTIMRVILGPDSPLEDIEFDVTGGAITVGPDQIPFNGPLVPSSLLANAKVGSDVSVSILCIRKGSSVPISIKGTLEVTQ
jgi:hypothetical protein